MKVISLFSGCGGFDRGVEQWYAFHPYYKEPLEDFKTNYIAFGCGMPNKILLFPLDKFSSWLDKMNTSERDGKIYWHVHFVEQKAGNVKLLFKEGAAPLDVTKYRVD